MKISGGNLVGLLKTRRYWVMAFRSTGLVLLVFMSVSGVAMGELVREVHPGEATSTSAAVVVDASAHLVYTPQILPIGKDGKTVISGNAAEKAEVVYERLESMLKRAGSGLDKLVKLDVYLASADAFGPFQKSLAGKLNGKSRPAVSYVVGALSRPEALVALDAVAVTSITKIRPGGGVAVLPSGSRIFVSGQANGDDADLGRATRKTLAELNETLKFLGLDRSRVVKLKAFMQPMTKESVAEVERAVSEFFGGEPIPPLSMVAWKSAQTTPIEIEMVVAGQGSVGAPVEYLTPPFLKASPLYSRLARVGAGSLIYFSGVYGSPGKTGAAEVESIFNTLAGLLAETGSDMRHLVKATYYVSDDVASRALNDIRPRYYDPKRPPAASKAFVAGVGVPGKTIVVDMIGVGTPK
jgi:enamine deaminase RidA (YjgF/YER057c/UK114 family)